MHIGHVGGSGGIDRGSSRVLRTEARSDRAPKSVEVDAAAISEDGRDTAMQFAQRVDAAAADDPRRAEIVAAASAQLLDGRLDHAVVYQAVAARLLAADFNSV